jgi:pimeloyl-ACP methyl ester carboxylesterase
MSEPPAVREASVRAGGVETFYREAGSGAGPPLVCVHGNPDTGELWIDLAQRAGELGRVIAPDLPGFGRSEHPPAARFDAHMDSYGHWFEAFLDALGIGDYRLAVHDWGALALAPASRAPERVARLAVIDAVPLHAGYRWHWVARVWRAPRLGELAMAAFNATTLRQLSRLSSPRPGPQDDGWIAQATRHLDAGTKRAILALYRSADPPALARAGERLPDLRCPALVVWGDGDPYIGLPEARRYAEVLPDARLHVAPGAGHWCLREDPAVRDELVAFLAAAAA